MTLTRFWPFGPHSSTGNNLTGITVQWEALNGAGIPTHHKAVDDYGPVFELMNIGDSHGVDNVCVFRLRATGGQNFDVPNWYVEPEVAAAIHIQKTLANLPPEFDKRVWLEIINEPDKDDDDNYPDWTSEEFADWLGRFAQRATELLREQDYRVAMFGFSSGEPEIPDWTTEGMLDFLRMAADDPDNIAVALHEYSFNPLSLEDATHPYPWLIGRFTKLFEICDANDIARPTVLITEFGWTLDHVPVPEIAMPQLEWAAEIYCSYPQVLAVSIWHFGVWFNSIKDMAQRLIEPMGEKAMTWRMEIEDMPLPSIPSDGYDSPVGTAIERASDKIYPGHWADVNPWMNYYQLRPGVWHYHTGSDLNLNYPTWDSDRFKPVYATANGVVTSARTLSNSWGKVIVLKHENGIYSRYAHLDTMLVSVGDVVSRGQQIGTVGRNLLDGPYHLHFDISNTQILESNPGHWPGINAQELEDNYVDPTHFIQRNRPFENGNDFATALWEESQNHQSVSLMPEAALQKAIFADGFIPVGSEYRQEFDGVHYACQVAEHLAYNERRVYYAEVGDWDNVKTVINGTMPTPPEPPTPPIEPPPPSGQEYDLSDYLMPTGQYGAIYEVRDPDGSQRRVQHQVHDDKLFITKGTGGLQGKSEWEELYVSSEYIWRGLDTSPGNGRYYRQWDPGYEMARWARRFMRVGETFVGDGHYVQFSLKSDCSPSAENSGSAENVTTFFNHLDSMEVNGIWVNDVIHIGREGGEEFWYAKDIGMVGWKSGWNESWISELHAPGQRPNNEMEVIPCLSR